MSSRWYTSDLRAVADYISAPVPSRRTKAFSLTSKEADTKCIQPGVDSLLHVSICCESFASHLPFSGSKECKLQAFSPPTGFVNLYGLRLLGQNILDHPA